MPNIGSPQGGKTGTRSRHACASRLLISLLIAITMSISLLSVMSLFHTAVASGSATVRLVPFSRTVAVDGTTTVDIVIDNATDLYGAEVHLRFDPGLLAVVDADGQSANGINITPGSLLAPSGAGGVAVNWAYNSTGLIDFAVTLTKPDRPVSGGGVLASITFKSLGPGVSYVDFFNPAPGQPPVKLAGWDGIEGHGTYYISVNPLSEPAAVIAGGQVTRVEVGSAAVVPGGSVTLPITARDIPGSGPGTGLAAFDFTIGFDPAVVNVTSVDPGAAPFDDPSTLTVIIDDVAGTVSFSNFLAAIEGPHGDIIVANLNVSAAGAAGTTDTLALAITTLADAGGSDIAATAVDGRVDIVAPALVASFSAALTAGAAPLAVQFSDQSTGSPITWSWSFGDGGTSAAQNPSHTYAGGGIYTVSLTSTWSDPPGFSDTITRPGYIKVIQASFSASPVAGVAPLAVQFTDTSTGPAADGWSWDFGDGGSSTAQSPSHTYTAGGVYTVSLTATSSAEAVSATASRAAYISVTVPMVAETSMAQEIDPDGIALIPVRVVRAKSPTTGETTTIVGGIRSYQGTAEFNAAGIQILDVRGAAPFVSPSKDLGVSGLATFSASHTEAAGPAAGTLAYLVPRLTGGANDTYILTLTFQSITDVATGAVIPQEAPVVKTYRRGDANDDGLLTIVDALFIAQHLARLRPLSGLNAINAASVQWNDGSDKITITDALFIAQYKALLRDASYNLIPK